MTRDKGRRSAYIPSACLRHLEHSQIRPKLALLIVRRCFLGHFPAGWGAVNEPGPQFVFSTRSKSVGKNCYSCPWWDETAQAPD